MEAGHKARERKLSDSKLHPGVLSFDADGTTLIGRYTDELSAYRAKRKWIEILKKHFLLDQGRDYELSILVNPVNKYFALNCYFTSACGRYAFWRLVNNQAPEAELNLTSSGSLLKEAIKRNRETKSGSHEVVEPTVLHGEQTARKRTLSGALSDYFLKLISVRS
ncbi:hypothetical protein JNK13_11815 [bacterium]|nr:hypothetical protein [bacterium]